MPSCALHRKLIATFPQTVLVALTVLACALPVALQAQSGPPITGVGVRAAL
jgi:hypothetical protein